MRRDATRVIYDILALGERGTSKTHITLRANLSHRLVVKYTVFLVKKGLLEINSGPEGSRYVLTEKGRHLFRLLQQVERELNDFYIMSLASELKARDRSSEKHPSLGIERDRLPIEIQRAALL